MTYMGFPGESDKVLPVIKSNKEKLLISIPANEDKTMPYFKQETNS
jgi:hypothetical protein